jgi:hypothetical protein
VEGSSEMKSEEADKVIFVTDKQVKKVSVNKELSVIRESLSELRSMI